MNVLIGLFCLSIVVGQKNQASFNLASGSDHSLSAIQAVQLAEKNRPAIKASELALDASMSQKSADGAYLPTVLSIASSTVPDIGAGEPFLISQPVDLFNTVGAHRRLGSAGVQLASAQLLQTKLKIQTDALFAFAQAAESQEQLRLDQLQLQIAQLVYNGTKKQVDAGSVAPGQLLQPQLDLERANAAALLAKNVEEANRSHLSGVLGTDLPPDTVLVLTPIEEPRGSILQRPDVLIAQANVNSSKASRVIESLSSAPTLSLDLRRPYFADREQYNFMVQLNWPIWDHGASKNRSKAANLALESNEKTLEDTKMLAMKEIAEAKLQDSSATASYQSFLKLDATATQIVQQTQKAYELGGTDLLAVLSAERSLREIQQGEAAAFLFQAQTRANYYAALGDLLK